MVQRESCLDIRQIFWEVDDFCRVFENLWKQAHLPEIGETKRASLPLELELRS